VAWVGIQTNFKADDSHAVSLSVELLATFHPAVPWLRWSVTGLSPRTTGFNSNAVHVGFVVDKVTLETGSSPST
jgi:hypothetical protein